MQSVALQGDRHAPPRNHYPVPSKPTEDVQSLPGRFNTFNVRNHRLKLQPTHEPCLPGKSKPTFQPPCEQYLHDQYPTVLQVLLLFEGPSRRMSWANAHKTPPNGHRPWPSGCRKLKTLMAPAQKGTATDDRLFGWANGHVGQIVWDQGETCWSHLGISLLINWMLNPWRLDPQRWTVLSPSRKKMILLSPFCRRIAKGTVHRRPPNARNV